VFLSDIPRTGTRGTATAAERLRGVKNTNSDIYDRQHAFWGDARMTDELLSLRAIVVSASAGDRDLFRQAAAASQVPIEIVAADAAAPACRHLAGGADLVYLDDGLTDEQCGEVVAAARTARHPSFTVQLAAGENGTKPFAADALAAKPVALDQAKRLVERSVRVRLPSRVLVVDDSATMRSIVRKLLVATRFPFDVTEAAEGFAALKLARESEFDLVFLDYNMPGFSGLETLSEFKREKRRMRVVIMTSMSDETLCERARQQGAAFLKKPFFPADIEAELCGFYGLRALNPKRAWHTD